MKIIDGFKFSNNHIMLYDERIHHNQGKRWTNEELEYICTFAEYDGLRSLSFAIGRTEKTIASKLSDLRKAGLLDYYRKEYMNRLEA